MKRCVYRIISILLIVYIISALPIQTHAAADSVSNNYPTGKTEYAAGVPLEYLLNHAGLRDGAKMITFIASDGYRREFTLDEILSQPRYSYTEPDGRQTVPAIVCLESGADGFDSLRPEELRLVMGQRAKGEQTNPWFVKYLSAIEVTCDEPEKWPEVTFSRKTGADGVIVTLDHESFDLVKIYYTTDGTHVHWAAQQGIVIGYPDGTFRPDCFLNR